jgi:hypothetical protein
MIVIIGLLILLAAAGVAVAGVAANSGSAHPVGDSFLIFGQSITGLSIGQVFLFGIITAVVGMLGLAMLFGTFNRRLASRGSRRALKGSQRESATLRLDRERLTQQLDDERSERLRNDAAPDPDISPAVSDADPAEAARGRRPDVDAVDDASAARAPVSAGHSGIWHRFSNRAAR